MSYRNEIPNNEWFPWSICNGCGMPVGNAYPSRHLVPSRFLGLACMYAPIVETRFPRTCRVFSRLFTLNTPRHFLDYATAAPYDTKGLQKLFFSIFTEGKHVIFSATIVKLNGSIGSVKMMNSRLLVLCKYLDRVVAHSYQWHSVHWARCMASLHAVDLYRTVSSILWVSHFHMSLSMFQASSRPNLPKLHQLKENQHMSTLLC